MNNKAENLALEEALKAGELEWFFEHLLPEYAQKTNKKDRGRSDEACAWIWNEPAFQRWLSSFPTSILTMFGDMGCGKTTVCSYVAEYLRTETPDSPKIVLFLECRAQKPTLYNVYVRIIRRLMVYKPQLKKDFLDWWYRETTLEEDKSLDDFLLGQFLENMIAHSAQPIFMILDGLDEMDTRDRNELLKLLRSLFHRPRGNFAGAELKAFVSSQHRSDIHETLKNFKSNPETQKMFEMDSIEMKPTFERDHILAEYFVARWTNPCGESLQKKAIEEFSRKAQGSAIWLQMVFSAFHNSFFSEHRGLELFTKWLATTPSLVALYRKIFESSISDPNVISTMEMALEVLAVARRPLAPEELASAVLLDLLDPKDNLQDLSIDVTVRGRNIMEWIRPFVTVDETTGRIGLVHQSLVELILKKRPTQWKSLEDQDQCGPWWTWTAEDGLRRQGQLHKAMLIRCITYIMSNNSQSQDLAKVLSDEEPFDHDLLLIQPDPDDKAGDLQPVPLKFDAEAHGLGNFFTYAAANWHDHFVNTPRNLRPEISTIVQLCGNKTRHLANWVEMWKRPNSHYAEERTFMDMETEELDPLAVMAYVDPTVETLSDIAQEKRNHPELFTEWSEWTLLELLMREGTRHLAVIRQLLEDPVIGVALCNPSALQWILRTLPPKKSSDPADWPGPQWVEILETLIHKLGPRLEPKVRLTLRLACQTGCLPLVKLLFQAAETWPELRTEMLSIDMNPGSGLFAHQFLGEAAYNGHAGVVSFLCQQEGIEPHLKYKNRYGSNVFHQSSRFAQSQILETLISLWPEGVKKEDKNGETLLTLLVFGNLLQTEDSTDTVALKTLLDSGGYDLPGLRPRGEVLDGEPMRIAVSKENTYLCRLFVVTYGADPRRVVEFESERVTKLRADRQPARADQGPHVVMGVLECFRSLIDEMRHKTKYPNQMRGH